MIKLPPQARKILDSVPTLIEKTFPIPGRFRRTLPSHVAELSRLLTGERGSRSLSYLSRPNFLSAYLHYFLPWNLYRLCSLLPTLDLNLSKGGTVIDLGSGPLTFVSALWIARPELRATPLEFNCIDRSSPALEAGKKFFTSLTSGAESPWKLNLIREEIDIRRPDSRKRKNAALVCAVNMFNEIYDNISHNNTEGLKRAATGIARITGEQASEDGRILIVEPGVPQSGKFISFLRDAFLELERPPLSPCTHTAACPLSNEKKRWCHFAFETTEAPKELHRLSTAAGIPKERLVFSFLLAGQINNRATEKTPQKKSQNAEARIISDAFALPNNRFGRYGCCSRGLILLTGEKSRIEKIASGDLVTPVFPAGDKCDEKSGALLAELGNR